MSISNLDNRIDGDLNSASSYLPDVVSLARMANELFSALPGAATVADVPSPAAAAVPAPTLEIPTFTTNHSPVGIPPPMILLLRASHYCLNLNCTPCSRR